MAMSADETKDLTKRASWALMDPPIGNPASIYSREFRQLFDIAFRADHDVSQASACARPIMIMLSTVRHLIGLRKRLHCHSNCSDCCVL